MSGGSTSAKERTDGQKPHRRLSPWASQPKMTKSIRCGDRVNVAVVRRKFMSLFFKYCIDYTLFHAVHTQKSGYLRLFGMLLTKSATINMITAPIPVGIITYK